MSTPAAPREKQTGGLPILQGILPLAGARVGAEVVAGVTLAALAIPEVMGYTKIAGTPVVTGLYTLLLPLAVYAVLGSSRHLVVGADSATAAIMAAGLVGIASVGSAEYMAYAEVLAILTGAILIVARLIRLGFLADFLSKTVLIGFLTGVGIQVAMGQVGGMLGVPEKGSNTITALADALSGIGQTNTTTLLISVTVLALIVGSGLISERIPGALIAVIGSIVASWALDLQADGVAVLGTVPGGLPSIAIPSGIDWSHAQALLATAFSMFLVILAQSAATSRAYAMKYSDRFSENVDLVGLSLANITAGFSGTFVVNGSPTKTEMVDSAGGRSQLAALVTAAITLVVLLFLTKPLQYMPNAVLASVVFLIGLRLVHVRDMREILRRRPGEFFVAVITAVVVVVVGVEQGILLAIVLSLIAHVSHSYRPSDHLVVTDDLGHWRFVPVEPVRQVTPGLAIYRFGASLYYANATRFTEETLGVADAADPPLKWLCIEASAIGDVDYSAAATLLAVRKELAARGVTLVLARVQAEVRAELDRYGLVEEIGGERIFDGLHEVVQAFGRDSPAG